MSHVAEMVADESRGDMMDMQKIWDDMDSARTRYWALEMRVVSLVDIASGDQAMIELAKAAARSAWIGKHEEYRAARG